MSSKIFITKETAEQARSTAELPLLEERIVTLIRYRLRMIELTADGATAGTYRKEIKTLVKAADIIFGPGHGKRIKAKAKEQAPYFEKDGGQAGTRDGREGGTVHSVTATLKPYGGWAGTSDGAKGGTLPLKEHKQPPWPRGPKAGTRDGRKGGTSAYTYGREAGVFVEQLPHDVAEGWKAGRPVAKDGGQAGTPLQQAAAKFNDDRWAGTSVTITGREAGTPVEPGQAPLDVNWTPFDDFAVGGTYGSYDEDKKQGKYIAKLIAKRQGQR